MELQLHRTEPVCPARQAARRQSPRRWRPRVSCDSSAAKTTTARQDPADRVGAEPTVLDIAPAVDLPKHRAEAAIGGFHPILQCPHRTSAVGRDAPDGDGVLGSRLTVEDEVNADFHEMDLLDVEADQCGTAEPGGRQQ
jgi:hypothetical protein